MSTRIQKVQRWLDLISFLVGRRFPVDVGQIMEHVPAYAERWKGGTDTERDSVRRMFERDKDELRELGIPLETVEYSVNYGMERTDGYRLARGDFYLPYLRLLSEADEDAPGAGPTDAFALGEDEAGLALEALDRILEREAFPLRDDARAARGKLTFDLDAGDLDPGEPDSGETEPGALETTPVYWVDPPGADRRRQSLDTLSHALLGRKRVGFGYHGIARDTRTERTVEPWGLLFQHSHWYLVGRDTEKDARRTFRVDRMEDLAVESGSGRTPDYRIPDAFELDDLRDREAWELGDDEPLEARVRFPFPRSLWAERNGLGALESREEDGAQVRRFRVVQADPFLRWLLSLAGEAEVLDPPELVEAFREMAARVAALYRKDPGPGDAAPHADGHDHASMPTEDEDPDG